MLIPTRLKVKLSKEKAYPIGAELISEALAGVPQFNKLKILFTPYNFAFASDIREARKQDRAYKIFQISMIHPHRHLSSSNQFIEEGFFEENWEISIYPVPRESKSIAKELIVSVLPKATAWLEKPRSEIWRTGRKHFQVLFREKDKLVSVIQD